MYDQKNCGLDICGYVSAFVGGTQFKYGWGGVSPSSVQQSLANEQIIVNQRI